MSKQFTITLSDTQVQELNDLTLHMRDGATTAVAIQKCIDAGITQLAYRYERNKTQWQKAKANRQLLNILIEENKQLKQRQAESDDEIVARD